MPRRYAPSRSTYVHIMDPIHRIALVMSALIQAGFSSPIEFVVFHLEYAPVQQRRAFFNFTNGISPFTNFLYLSSRMPQATPSALSLDTVLIELMLSYVGYRLHTEGEALHLFSKLPINDYRTEHISKFSFQKIAGRQREVAPIFHQLLSNFILHKKPQNADLTQPPSNSTNNGGTHDAKKTLEMTIAISILMYARNRTANHVQGIMGYFLAATKTGKRAISVLSNLGISISPESIINLQEVLAKSAMVEYKKAVLERPCVLSYDNMNYKASVKMHLLHKTPHIQSDTAGYVYFPNITTSAKLALSRAESLDTNQIKIMKALDYMPRNNHKYHRDAARIHAYRILIKYFPQIAEAAKRKRRGAQYRAPAVNPISPLPLKKTTIYTLPTLPLDEAKVTETIEIIKAFMKELDIQLVTMKDLVVMFKGDYLTIRNVCLAMYQRQDCRFINWAETLDFIEPVIGLFHLQMNVQQLISETFWGGEEGKDPASLKRFVTLVRNNRVKKESKDFRANKYFLSDVLDGFVMASYFHCTSTKTLDEFSTFVKDRLDDDDAETFWISVANSIVDGLYDAGVFSKMFNKEIEQRDYPIENSFLFMRDMLTMRDYEDAVKCGDPGRLELIIRHWNILYQGTTKTNYSMELLHLVSCLEKLWKEPMRNLWMASCLVNPSGRAGAWVPDDLFGEYVIRENKDRIRPSSNALIGDHNREVYARQIMTNLASRSTMFHTTGATNYYNKSKLADSRVNVKTHAEHIIAYNLLVPTPGRTASADGYAFQACKDLYKNGIQSLFRGRQIKKLKLKSKAYWATQVQEYGENYEEEEGFEMYGEDDDILDDI